MSSEKYRQQTDALLARLGVAKLAYQTEKAAWVEAEDQIVDAEEAQRVAQLVAQTVQQQAHHRIAGVVSRCLQAVFDDPYEFKILFEQKRGRTEAQLVFVQEGQAVDPMTASGGGVVDVAAFALRLSCILLSKPPVRRVLILDEPFKFLSREYHERARLLLESLADELKVQIIMVTHIEALKTGTIIEL